MLRMSQMPGKTVAGEKQVFFANHVFHRELIPALITLYQGWGTSGLWAV